MWSRLPLAENEEKLLKWPRAQTVKKAFAFSVCVCGDFTKELDAVM